MDSKRVCLAFVGTAAAGAVLAWCRFRRKQPEFGRSVSPIDTSNEGTCGSIGGYVLTGAMKAGKRSWAAGVGADSARWHIRESAKVDPDALECVRRELTALRTLGESPHISALREVMQTPEHIYVVTELAGGNLRGMVSEVGALDEEPALYLWRGVASALEFIHARGIAHRNVAPENILLDVGDQFSCRLGGFSLSSVQVPAFAFVPGASVRLSQSGLRRRAQRARGPGWLTPGEVGTVAKVEAESAEVEGSGGSARYWLRDLEQPPSDLPQRCTSPVGSPLYVAPEVCDGAYCGMKADIWSAGICLFEMLTGDAPGGPESIELVVHDPQYEGSFRGQRLRAQTKQLLRELLQLRAEDRPQAYAVVRHRAFAGL
eukprot:TRINITY_DN43472_c0_g1_i1.p1 TRINITY_DN43472_c0_g1~~TRINITY_DN43472_c0_g1_i1.p1  ORF type:complete len:374 (+),score=77.69 TRINITY_DN43472_c0_g1_i1:45-1166(+)